MKKIIKEADVEKTLGLEKAIEFEISKCDKPLGFKEPILKKNILEAHAKAAEILARAKKEAEGVKDRVAQILAKAEKEYEEEKKRGFEEGRQEGLAIVTGKITELHATHEKMLSDSEGEVVTLIRSIAEKVIAREVEKGAVVDVVKRAVSQLVGNKITVRVNPADTTFLKEKEKELLAMMDSSQSISFREDPEIAAGGCIVDSELGTIDAQLPLQIASIKKSLGL